MDKTLIISIHGILTDVEKGESKDWQERFDNWLRQNYPEEIRNESIVHLPFSYGILTPLLAWGTTILRIFKLDGFLSSQARKKFKKFVENALSSYDGYKVHIVAHSFGTWITHEVLKDCHDIKVDGLFLFGSVISAHIRKNYIDEALMTKQIKRCINWCSHDDVVARLAPTPFGHLGYWGFLTADPTDRVKPRHKPFTHLDMYNKFTKHTHTDYFVHGTFQLIIQDINLINKLRTSA